MSRRLLLSFTLSAALHVAALAAVLASRSVEEERAVFTVDVAWEAAPADAATAGSSAPQTYSPSPSGLTRGSMPVDPQGVVAAVDPGPPDQVRGRQFEDDRKEARAMAGAAPAPAVSPAAARDTTETTRSYRRRQVVAATRAKSSHADSSRDSGPSESVAAGAAAAPAAAEPAGGGETGAALANAADGSASGSSEPSSGRSEAVYRVAPAYPLAARRRGLEGSVLLRVRFDAEGRPEEVVVKTGSGSEMLDSAAREAVSRWRFGGAAAGSVDAPITFRLRGADAVQVTDAGTGREP
jgi:protein TonB